MISLRDALSLATTKLKTRKIRLIVTSVVSGLFFIVLMTFSLIFSGVSGSVSRVGSGTLNERYIVQVQQFRSYSDGFDNSQDQELIDKLSAEYKVQEEQKKARAAELGIVYEPNPLDNPVVEDPISGEEYINYESSAASSLRPDTDEADRQRFTEDLEEAKADFDIIGQYGSVRLFDFGQAPSYYLKAIVDGKEKPEITDEVSDGPDISGFGGPPPNQGLESIASNVRVYDDKLIEPFLLEGQSFEINETDESKTMPVIVPMSAAEDIAGLESLPIRASSAERVEHLRNVRQSVTGASFQACIRSSSSISDQQNAISSQKQEAEYQADKSNTFPPRVVYRQQSEPCQSTLIDIDRRSQAERDQDDKRRQLDIEFGAQESTQRLIDFKIVGIVPDLNFDGGFSVTDIFSGLFYTSVEGGWLVPSSTKDLLPEFSDRLSTLGQSVESNGYENISYFEFSGGEEASRFADERSCSDDQGFFVQEFAFCSVGGGDFYITPFASNSIALSDAKQGFSNVFRIFSLVIAAISSIIMMGTVGKIISDGRRETAVFRAIGARRLDIAQIYLTYTLMIGLVISAVVLLSGLILSSIFNHRYSDDFTTEALRVFNPSDLDQTFSLVGFDLSQIASLVAIILAGCLLSAVIPLAHNLRRNPLNDMRDER